MARSGRIAGGLVAAFALAMVAARAPLAQGGGGGQDTTRSSPWAIRTSMSNPYKLVENWPHLGNIKPGAAIGIIPDKRGGLWLSHRSEPPILHIDANGNVVKMFADGMFVSPHGFCQDHDGNFWAGDSGPFGDDAKAKGKGFVVYKFSPEGKLLMTLGKPGVSQAGSDTFVGPTGCAVAANGDILITDGHIPRPSWAQQDGDRIVRYTKDGKFVQAWGKQGTGPGEFWGPHAIAFDSQGRIFVADRSNNRVQLFDKDMNFVDDWKHFGRPSGISILKDDTLFVSDSESAYGGFRPAEIGPSKPGENIPRNGGWRNGIRIGSAKDGSLKYFVAGTRPEGLAADESGFILAGLTAGCDQSPSGGCLQKWIKK